MPSPPMADVVDAINAPVTSVSRRVEIYEADGATPWRPDDTVGTLLDGSISVDSTRDERRSLDLTLDNSSGVLKRDPQNGFWYDKIIKIFRGIEYSVTSRYTDMIKAEAPALYVRMDGNAVSQDLSAYAMHMRRVGFPVLVQPLLRSPDARTSSRFTDVSTYFITENLSAGHPATTSSVWTFEAWVRPLGTSTSWGGQIFGRNAIDAGAIRISSSGYFQVIVRDSDGILVASQSPTPYVSGRVYYISATSDGAFLKLYVNGDLVSNVSWSGHQQSTNTGFSAGGDTTGAREFRGDMSSCVYYDRALSLNEIKQHYITGIGRANDRLAWEAQVGEFMIDKIDEPRFPSQVKITARDYTKRCLNAKLSTAMTFDRDTPIETLVRAMAANAGIGRFILPQTGLSVGDGADFDQGTERWSVMSKICAANAYELFFNSEGYLTLRKQLDPSTSPSSLTLKTGAKGNLVDWTKSSVDTEVYNRVICVSSGSDSILPFYGEAVNNNPISPTGIPRLGERTWIYSSAFFTSNDQCAQTARQFLSVKGLESFNIDFSSLVFPWMEAGEIVDFLDPAAADYDPTRFLLSSFSIPLKLGAMSGSAKRVIIVNPFDSAGSNHPL